jgi:hypothetical protein
MKIKRSELEKIIKEEITRVVEQEEEPVPPKEAKPPRAGEIEKERSRDPEEKERSLRRKKWLYDATVSRTAMEWHELTAAQRYEVAKRAGMVGKESMGLDRSITPKKVVVINAPFGKKLTEGYIRKLMKKAGLSAPEVLSTTLTPNPKFPETKEWGTYSGPEKEAVLQKANIHVMTASNRSSRSGQRGKRPQRRRRKIS